MINDSFNNVPQLFKVVKPKYSILKIVPDTSIRNYDSENIARVICSMYSLPIDRIGFKDFQFSYRLPYKTSFFIDISIKGVSFFVIIPEEYEKLITEKCSNTWPRATITKIESISMFTDKSVKYEMVYKKEDALSLKVDRKSNEPLNSILRVMDIMEQDDRVGIYYNFMPGEQMAWKNKHRDTLEKIKKNVPIDKEKFTVSYVIKFLFEELMKLVVVVFDQVAEFIGGEGKSLIDETAVSQLGINSFERLSESTLRKGDKNILDSQLIVLSDSQDDKRRKNNAVAVCESYKSISEDNSLNYKRYKKAVYYNEYKVKGATVNILSTDEATNFFQIPGRTLLQQYPVIEKVDVLENPIPDELSKGYIYLGTSTYKGKDYPAYLRDEYNQGNLPLTLMGPQGSGKTTFIANYVMNAYNRNEPVILIDFIKNCELSTAIEKIIPKSALTIIDLSKSTDLQGLGYNEIKINADMDEYELLELSNLQAQQTMCLIDAINSEGLPLTSKMRRYLSSAANIVFLQENSNIRDVINCLQDFRKRADFIFRIPDGLKEYLEDEVNTLRELDEYTTSKDPNTKEIASEVTGTKDSKIDGILDRINLLKEDAKLKYMFNKKLIDNIDLVNEIDKGKIILIKMPEIKFPLSYVKNVLVTYFTTKIWLALQIRGARYEKPKRCHFIIDEIYQAPTCERILREVLPQSRKFGGKFVISCHYLSQIEPIREALKASGSSFMLFQGTDKKNYEELKEELQPYELEDLLNIKQFHSLNLIKYEKGYARFITHLPLPV
jgi:GTPase SAR1 family protein